MINSYQRIYRVVRIAVIAAAFIVLSCRMSAAAAPPRLDFCDGGTYCVKVERADMSLFPTVKLWVDVRDKVGSFVENLTQDNFVLSEDGNAINPTKVALSKDGEIGIHFIFDVPLEHQVEAVSKLGELVQVLAIGSGKKQNQATLWNTKFGENALVPFTKDGGMLVNHASPGLSQVATSVTLEQLLRALVNKHDFKKPNIGNSSRQAIIVLTSHGETDWDAISKIASEKFIPIYVLRFDSFQNSRAECAKETNGFCLHYTELSGMVGKLSSDIEQRLGQEYLVEYESNLFPAHIPQKASIQVRDRNQQGETEFPIEFGVPTEDFIPIWDQMFPIIAIILTLFAGYCATFVIYLQKHLLDTDPATLWNRLFEPVKYSFAMTGLTIVLAYAVGLLPFSLETLPNNVFYPFMVRGTKASSYAAPALTYEPTATFAPTFTPSPTATPSATPTLTATTTSTPTFTSTVTHTPTSLLSPTATFTPTNTFPSSTPLPKPPELRWGQNCLAYSQFISEPKDLTELSGTQTTLDIKGTAALPNFDHYQIDLFHPPSHLEPSGIPPAVKGGKSQVNNDALGSFDIQIRGTNPPQWIAPGWYIIRLRVTKNDGNYLTPECYSRIYIPVEHPVQ